MLQGKHDENSKSLDKFELMLKSNDIYFFDAIEFENIIQYYLNNGKVSLAKKAVKLGLEQHPSAIELKLLHVEILVLEDKLILAETYLDELYLLSPNNEEVFIQKANILSKKDKHKKAIECLKIALDLTNEKADIYALIGMEHLFLDDYFNAKECFIKSLALDESDYASLYNALYCFEFLELYEDAIAFLNNFLERNPYCEIAWHQLGKLYFNVGDYSKALTAFDFAIISDDLFVGAYIEKGKTLEKLKKYAAAIENYTITLELDDPTSYALLRIGKCYEKLYDSKKALKYFNQTIKEDPLLDKGWIAIVDYYIRLKEYNKASYYINKALEIDNQNITYWKKYAHIYDNLNLYEEAEIGLRKMLNLGNYELNTWLKRADILKVLGELDAAVENLSQALEFYPDNAEITFRLAGLYYVLNQEADGKEYLIKSLRTDSDFVIILEELFPKIYRRKQLQDIITKH